MIAMSELKNRNPKSKRRGLLPPAAAVRATARIQDKIARVNATASQKAETNRKDGTGRKGTNLERIGIRRSTSRRRRKTGRRSGIRRTRRSREIGRRIGTGRAGGTRATSTRSIGNDLIFIQTISSPLVISISSISPIKSHVSSLILPRASRSFELCLSRY